MLQGCGAGKIACCVCRFADWRCGNCKEHAIKPSRARSRPDRHPSRLHGIDLGQVGQWYFDEKLPIAVIRTERHASPREPFDATIFECEIPSLRRASSDSMYRR